MKNIIFINQVTGPLLIDMVNVFAEKDHKVILYTGEISKTSNDLDQRVIVKKLTTYKKDNNVNRLVTWFLFFSQSLFYLKKDLSEDSVIYFSSNPPFIPWITLFYKNTSYIHIYDVYPNALLALPYITKKSFIYKAFLYLNKKSFDKCKKVFTPSQGMKEMLINSITKEKVRVIPWWADTEFIKPINKSNNTFINDNKLHGKFIVMYSGNFGLTHNIEKILNSALLLRDESNIKFIIIGAGPKKRIVDSFERKHKLDNLLILPFQDQATLPYSMAASDISVVLDSFSSNREGDSTASIPSKTYYLMSAGSVIYAESDNTSELNELIKNNKIGLCDSTQGTEIFINFIKECLNNRELLEELKENSRLTSLKFTKKNANMLYNEILKID